MIKRKYLPIIEEKLNNFSVVGLLGPRQIGKTTLAKVIAETRPTLYLDLENYQDLAKLENPIAYLELHADKLIILDEIQRKPDLFMVLRGLIDKWRQAGRKYGQFLILGSASLDLLRQSAESLAGRIVYLEMGQITVAEIAARNDEWQKLWLRGGFPDSFLAESDITSIEWRQAFLKTYLERDVPQFGPRIPAETLRRLWVMLAHLQGTALNLAKLAGNLSISGQTVSRYIDLLTDLFLLRRLSPWHNNIGKRLVRSPKIYVRDSGILHALLNIQSLDNLFCHPILGASWEGFVIDNVLSFLPVGTEAYFYSTARGAEIDLVLKHADGRLIAIEIKHSAAPKLERGFYNACEDIQPTHRYVVYSGIEKFPIRKNVYAISLLELLQEISV
jgi:uncharacterized protein